MKMYKIVNFEIFRSKLLELGSTSEVANKIKVAPCTISNCVGKAGKVLSSRNIKKILDAYELTPEDLGVEEYEYVYGEKANISFSERIKELLKENNILQKDFAEDIGKDASLITMWIKGKRAPDLDSIQLVADYFGVSTLYLIGETNIKDADNEEITKILRCDEYLLDFIKKDNPQGKRILFDGFVVTADEIDEGYYDMKTHIFCDVGLLHTLKSECDRIIKYYTSKEYYNDYEKCINEFEVYSHITERPVRHNIEKVANDNICEALTWAFNKYVNNKLTEIFKKNDTFKNKYTGQKPDVEITNSIKLGIDIYHNMPNAYKGKVEIGDNNEGKDDSSHIEKNKNEVN